MIYARTPPTKDKPEGAVAILDLIPTHEGNVHLDPLTGIARTLTKAELADKDPAELFHTSHFATCPDRQRFRG